MNKFEALILTGKLEIILDNEKLEEIKSIQRTIIEEDHDKLPILIGRLSEKVKSNERACKLIKELSQYCTIEDKKTYKLDRLNLSTRSYNGLKRAEIFTVEEILKLDSKRLYQIRNLGISSINEIIEKMKQLGFDDWARSISIKRK